jgi:hypothetical protein
MIHPEIPKVYFKIKIKIKIRNHKAKVNFIEKTIKKMPGKIYIRKKKIVSLGWTQKLVRNFKIKR